MLDIVDFVAVLLVVFYQVRPCNSWHSLALDIVAVCHSFNALIALKCITVLLIVLYIRATVGAPLCCMSLEIVAISMRTLSASVQLLVSSCLGCC